MTTEQLEAKLAHNPESPFYAMLANVYLSEGRTAEAKLLCQAGLKRYPSYTTGYFILAKCFAAEGNFRSAASALQDLKSLGTNSELVENFYQQCMMRSVAVPQPSEKMSPTEYFDRSMAATAPSPAEESLPPTDISTEELSQIRPATIEDEKRIISKTLAEIYASQGEFGEAILTYQLLKRQSPESTLEFEERIRELEILLEQKLAALAQQNQVS